MHSKHRRRVRRALQEIESRQVTPRPHGLDRPLVVTLTSYPARFETLAPTLRGLLRQNVAADDTQLFLTEKDAKQLPQDVLELQSQGLDAQAFARICGLIKNWCPPFERTPIVFL